MVKHGLETNLEDLDFKTVDKEMRQMKLLMLPKLLRLLARIL